jgi:hypothetical protein
MFFSGSLSMKKMPPRAGIMTSPFSTASLEELILASFYLFFGGRHEPEKRGQ